MTRSFLSIRLAHARRCRRGGGMTLVEVLVAMAIFLVGITAILGLFHFGGGLESGARSHADLAPSIEPLVEHVRHEAWLLDAAGGIGQLREMKAQPIPGAPDYLYDVVVDPPGDDPELRRARLVFYRDKPERPVASVRFLLPRAVPVDRRLAAGANR